MTGKRFVLVHSPLVGPDTWGPVAVALRRAGYDVLVPVLPDVGPPYWEPQVGSIVEQVRRDESAAPLVLVGHSGAGPLLAPLGRSLREHGVEVAAYLLVDAGLPTRGQSRLEQMHDEAPDRATALEQLLRDGGSFPRWGDEVLVPLVPDADRRRRLLDGLRPQPLAYWTEPLPDVPEWPDAPCGALLFSEGYGATAGAARDRGWRLRDLGTANHFAMLADPDLVARELLALTAELIGS